MFANLCISLRLREDSWDIVSASAWEGLPFVILVEVYEENVASRRFVLRKWVSYSGYYGYSSLGVH